MDVEKAIDIRKSIRKYQDKQVSQEIIIKLLDAARKAPSAHNTQSHKYFIVKDEETMKKFKKANAFKQPFVYDAPLIIICCSNPSLYPKPIEVDDKSENYAHEDLSIASSFLVLQATELGLGTVFVAWMHREKIKKILKLPKNYIIPFAILIGYPAEEPAQKPRKDLNEIIF